MDNLYTKLDKRLLEYAQEYRARAIEGLKFATDLDAEFRADCTWLAEYFERLVK